ncbi:MAG: hypothetical protein K0R10_352 [Alphaproteobacteria bacterium]|jgi:hypothetical protein|nr:hypothetical protein [Alphaproteobacteria bacterium]
MSTESFDKDNAYTLVQNINYISTNHHNRSIARIFNFKAAQVTTVTREWISGTAGNTIHSQLDVRNFSEIDSKDEIREMHQRLVTMGGTPPAIDDILPQSAAKPKVLAMGGK